MEIKVFESISDMHKDWGLAPPENPLFSILHMEVAPDEIVTCQQDESFSMSITNGFYNISFKHIISGEIMYGRTKYDSTSGTLFFTSPNQTMVYKGIAFSSESYHLCFHKDFLNGTPLFDKIKSYDFFNYNINEALHLSPKEEKILKNIFMNIKSEYFDNQDEFSKDILLTHLEALLKYSDRFYKRQFLNRKEVNQTLYTRFKSILNDYFISNQLETKGTPSLGWIAEKLGLSQAYMSASIKSETGKTAKEQMNLFLIEEAKNLLLTPESTISEIAYKLGFEYPQYFSRLFKKKVGVSPKEYVETASSN